MNRSRASSYYLTAAFVITTLVSGTLIAMAWRSFRNVEETAALVQHTLQTQRDLNALGSALADAETAQRGYLLTGIAGYLTPFQSAVRVARAQIPNLRLRLAGDSANASRAALLDTLAQAKLGELQTTLRLAAQGNHDSALEVVRTNVGDSLMRSIRATLHDAEANESSLLAEREAALESAFHLRNMVSLALGIILALVLLWIAFMLKRLRRYQNLVTLCAWSKTVNYRGEWLSFEEYLRRRFKLSITHGISPEALAGIQADVE